MINFWNDRLKVLNDIRKKRTLSKKKAKYKTLNKCKVCGTHISSEELNENLYICKCGAYFPMPAKERVRSILDPGYLLIPTDLPFKNRLEFPDYDQKYMAACDHTGLDEAVVIARGSIMKRPVIVFVMERDFLMGSMGMNTGRYIAKAIQLAMKESLPLISFSVSGGARMQEGIFSLMQMANTVNYLGEFLKTGLYISVFTNPTMGGVSASFSSLGDIVLAEKGAHIGFSGPRVIEKTLNLTLPEGFQEDESLLKNGFLDDIIQRSDFRSYLGKLLDYHEVPCVD